MTTAALPITADLDVTVRQDEIIDALRFVTKNLPSRPSTQLQVLAGVLLGADAGLLTLSTFDYETASTQTIPGSGSGRALVSAKQLTDLVKDLPKGSIVELEVISDRLCVTGDGVTYKLPLLDLAEYPELPAADGFIVAELPAEVFARVADVAVAAGTDDTLPVLTQVQFAVLDGRLHFSATDRYRLTAFDTGVPAILRNDALLSAKVLTFAAAAFKGQAVTVRQPGTEITVLTAGSRSLVLRGQGGTFPQWERLLPARGEGHIRVQVKPLAKAVAQVAKVAARTAPIMLASSPDALTLTGGAGSETQAEAAVPAVSINNPVTIGFNPGYLTDGLKAVGGDTVRMQFSTTDPEQIGRKPVVFERDGVPEFRYLLMPVRLSS